MGLDTLLDGVDGVQFLLQDAAKLEMGSELIEVSFGPIFRVLVAFTLGPGAWAMNHLLLPHLYQ